MDGPSVFGSVYEHHNNDNTSRSSSHHRQVPQGWDGFVTDADSLIHEISQELHAISDQFGFTRCDLVPPIARYYEITRQLSLDPSQNNMRRPDYIAPLNVNKANSAALLSGSSVQDISLLQDDEEQFVPVEPRVNPAVSEVQRDMKPAGLAGKLSTCGPHAAKQGGNGARVFHRPTASYSLFPPEYSRQPIGSQSTSGANLAKRGANGARASLRPTATYRLFPPEYSRGSAERDSDLELRGSPRRRNQSTRCASPPLPAVVPSSSCPSTDQNVSPAAASRAAGSRAASTSSTSTVLRHKPSQSFVGSFFGSHSPHQQSVAPARGSFDMLRRPLWTSTAASTPVAAGAAAEAVGAAAQPDGAGPVAAAAHGAGSAAVPGSSVGERLLASLRRKSTTIARATDLHFTGAGPVVRDEDAETGTSKPALPTNERA